MADMGGFQFESMPQDYSYVNPGGAGQSFDWSQPSFASMPDYSGFGGGQQQGGGNNFDFQNASYSDFPNASYSTQMPQGWGVTNPNGPGLPDQSQIFQEQAFAPSTGKATGSAGSQQQGNKEDDWKKMLMKMGLGAGVGLMGEAGKSLFGGGSNQPKQQSQQSQPLPQAPSSVIPQTAPMQPLPGTKASPLISGMPQSVQQSTGLRMRQGGSTGGLQLY